MAGAMGWTEREFWRSSLRYFHAAWRGHRRGQEEAWERARWHAWISLSPYVEKGKKMDLDDLGRFPWEPAPPERVITDEQRAWLQRFHDDDDTDLIAQINPELAERLRNAQQPQT